MLCTVVSAWSYETETITKWCRNGNNGIVSESDLGMITGQYDKTTDTWKDVLGITYIEPGRVIISVEFNMRSGSIDQCESTKGKWKVDDTGKWVQDGTFAYDDKVVFKSTTGCLINSVTITYHKHTLTKNTDSKAATCMENGMKTSWKCSDCGHIYLDEKGENEVEETDLIIPKEQGSHNHLSFVAQKDATCTESGYAMNHYHCSDCGKNFEDEACTKQITTDVTIPAINHKNKKFNEAVAPTTEATGNVAYWHCPDCNKNFENEGCTKEIAGTDYELEKLMNMMHLDFTGTSAPIETEHYLNTAKFNFTDDGDIILTVNDKSVTYGKGMIGKVQFSNGTPTAQISANEDPENKGTYYSTFYSRLESYAVPKGFTVYRGEISDDGTKLSLTSVKDDVMSSGEGYILKGTASSGSMNVTANAGSSSDNVLLGTDVATTLSTNDYALSLGQKGVGFYLWEGKAIGANKAYLIWDGSKTSAKAFTFQFEDETDAIQNCQLSTVNPQLSTYNLNGVRVNNGYKGIVIVNGKKVYQR